MAKAFEKRFAYSIPVMRDLVVAFNPISIDKPVSEVIARFNEHTNLLALPLLAEGQFGGLLSRRSFLNYFSKAYTRELFNKKTLDDLLIAAPHLAECQVFPEGDARIDEVLRQLIEMDPEHEVEVIPVQERGQLIGVVTVAELMLKISSSQSQLIQTLEVLSERLKGEVEHAALLQRTLLPPAEVELPGLSGYAQLLTSSEVGGDYYDYFSVQPHQSVFVVGDASGHGVASGTIVSAAKAGLNLLAGEGVFHPCQILERLNQTIYSTAQQSLLMTMFCASLDTEKGVLTFANAGHQFAYLWSARAGEWSMLEIGGMPLGKAADTRYVSDSVTFEPGDRLFLYTDGVVEAESREGEAFGYERLEALLRQYAAASPTVLQGAILDMLRKYCASTNFADDITFFTIDYISRVAIAKAAPIEKASTAPGTDIVRIADPFYRANPSLLSSKIARQSLIFLAENSYADLLPRLCQDGIRRILPRHDLFLHRFGWDKLLAQHTSDMDALPDLYRLLPLPLLQRRLDVGSSDDKAFIMAEVEAWLAESGFLQPDKLDATILILDELFENGVYAAPRDGQNQPLYRKGVSRILGQNEDVHIEIALNAEMLGISIRDNWGTLTPVVFFQRLVKHLTGQGLEAGEGGAGLYLLWRMADYLQFRVHPNRQTQVTVFLDLQTPLNPDADKGVQFLYHNECNEVLSHE